jgi:uncharacterized protein YciW
MSEFIVTSHFLRLEFRMTVAMKVAILWKVKQSSCSYSAYIYILSKCDTASSPSHYRPVPCATTITQTNMEAPKGGGKCSQ